MRHEPSSVPYFSMTRAERWLYFHTLDPLLGLWPWPVWRTPAMLIATIRLVTERYTDSLAREMLLAVGKPTGGGARLRYRWRLWYAHEAERFLLLQSRKLTPAWARRHITTTGALPEGGALLIMPHHACSRVGVLAIAGIAGPLGGITGRPRDPETFALLDVTLRHVFARGHIFARQAYGERHFSTQGFAARNGLRLLREGGYLVSYLDSDSNAEPTYPLFERQVTLFTAGTIWLAERSARPIVPVIVATTWRGWHLWIGEPITPTDEAIRAAIEARLRLTPECWQLSVAMSWHRAVRSKAGSTHNGMVSDEG